MKKGTILTVDPSQILINFSYPIGQNTLTPGVSSTVNATVTNNTGCTLKNVTVSQSAIQVYVNGTQVSGPNCGFTVYVTGGQLSFGTINPASNVGNTSQQGFFVSTDQNALQYVGQNVTFSIDTTQFMYDVVADSGSTPSSSTWNVNSH